MNRQEKVINSLKNRDKFNFSGNKQGKLANKKEFKSSISII